MNQCEFPGTKASVPDTRAWLRAQQIDSGELGDAELVLSELAANAVRHTRSGAEGGTFRVRLYLGGARLRVEVTDEGADTAPVLRRARLGAEASPACPDGESRSGPPPVAEEAEALLGACGRGLDLVEQFTECWWVRGGPDGRTVGAELAL